MLLTPHRKEFLIHSGAFLMVGFVAYLFWRHMQTINALDVGAGSSGAIPDPILPGASPWGLSGFQPGGTGYFDPSSFDNSAPLETGAPALSLAQALDALGPSTSIAPLGMGTYDYQAPAAGDSGSVAPTTQSGVQTPTQAPLPPGGGSGGGGGGSSIGQRPPTGPVSSGTTNFGKQPTGSQPQPVAPDSSAAVDAAFQSWNDANPIQTPQLEVPTAQIPKSKIPVVTVVEGADLVAQQATASGNADAVDQIFQDYNANHPFQPNTPDQQFGTVVENDVALPSGGADPTAGQSSGSMNDSAALNGIADYGSQLADNTGYNYQAQAYNIGPYDGVISVDNPFGAFSNDPGSSGGGGAFDDGSQNPFDSTSNFFYE